MTFPWVVLLWRFHPLCRHGGEVVSMLQMMQKKVEAEGEKAEDSATCEELVKR